MSSDNRNPAVGAAGLRENVALSKINTGVTTSKPDSAQPALIDGSELARAHPLPAPGSSSRGGGDAVPAVDGGAL